MQNLVYNLGLGEWMQKIARVTHTNTHLGSARDICGLLLAKSQLQQCGLLKYSQLNILCPGNVIVKIVIVKY